MSHCSEDSADASSRWPDMLVGVALAATFLRSDGLIALRAILWRRLGGLLAACLVVLLAATPALDALVCQGDAPTSAPPATLSQVLAGPSVELAKSHTPPVGSPRGGEAGDVCPHGHCHHFSVFALDEPLRPVRTAFLEARAMDARQSAPPSLPGSTPERPPRA